MGLFLSLHLEINPIIAAINLYSLTITQTYKINHLPLPLPILQRGMSSFSPHLIEPIEEIQINIINNAL